MKTVKLPTTTQLAEFVSTDHIVRKDNVYTFRHGYYYKHTTEEAFAARIMKDLQSFCQDNGFTPVQLEIGDTGPIRFRGGAPVSKQSHVWVKVELRRS